MRTYTYTERKAIAAHMINILFDRGYTHQTRLFDLIHELFPSHGLHDATLRTMIHDAKTGRQYT